MTTYKRGTLHYAIGTSTDSPCGLTSMWHRGLIYDRDPERVTCGHCLRWLRKQAARVASEPKVVSR